MKNQTRFSRLLVAALLVLSVISFVATAYHFWAAVNLTEAYARLLDELDHLPIPSPPSIGFQTMVFNTLRYYQTAGIVLMATGIVCAVLALSFHRKFRAVAMILLMLLTVTFVPPSWASGSISSNAGRTRWYVHTRARLF